MHDCAFHLTRVVDRIQARTQTNLGSRARKSQSGVGNPLTSNYETCEGDDVFLTARCSPSSLPPPPLSSLLLPPPPSSPSGMVKTVKCGLSQRRMDRRAAGSGDEANGRMGGWDGR